MKVALDGLSPAQVAWSRLLLGGLTLGAVRRDRGANALPRSLRDLGTHDGARGVVLRRAVPALLLGAAARDVGPREHLQRDDPDHDGDHGVACCSASRGSSPCSSPASLVGILGVVVIIAPWQGLDLSQSLVAQLAILGATACYGFSLAYMRKFVSNTGHVARWCSRSCNIGIAAVDHAAADAAGRRWRRCASTRWSSAASCSCSACLGTGVAYIWNQNTRARLGTHARVDRDLHHAGRRRGCSASSSSASRSAGTSRSARSSCSSASCSRRTACGCRDARARDERANAPARSSAAVPASAGPRMRHPPARDVGSVLLQRALQVERDRDVLADEHAAGLEGGVPGEAEVLAVDDRLGGRAGLVVAPRVGAEAAELELEGRRAW